MIHSLICVLATNLFFGYEPVRPERAWRLEDEKEGVVRVWHPDHIHELEEIVIFVHGDNATADSVWRKRKIKEQFVKSGQKALFIVPTSTRQGWREPVKWKGPKNLERLIALVLKKTKVKVDRSRITLIAHSAGYRMLASWLGHKGVHRIILSESMFGFAKGFRRWVDAADDHQIVIAVSTRGKMTTRPWAKPFVDSYSDAAVFLGQPPDEMPHSLPKVVYVEIPDVHVNLFRKGLVIPMALRIRLASASDASHLAFLPSPHPKNP